MEHSFLWPSNGIQDHSGDCLPMGLRGLGGFIEGQSAASQRHGEAIWPVLFDRAAPLMIANIKIDRG